MCGLSWAGNEHSFEIRYREQLIGAKMPKITKDFYRGYTVPVSYELKTAKFSIILPDEMKSYGIFGKLTANTQQDVEYAFHKVVDQFILEGADRVKFIAIKSSNDSNCEDEFVRANGIEGYLNLQYAIVSRVKINGEYHYKYLRNPNFSDPNQRESNFYAGNNIIFIEWTEKREAFLRKAVDAVRELSLNIKNFIENENVIKMIDSNKTILLLENKDSK